MGTQDFNRWKARTMHKIMELIHAYENMRMTELAQDLEALLEKIRTAKRRDMPTILNEIWTIYRKWREEPIYRLIPNEATYFNIMSGPEEPEEEVNE